MSGPWACPTILLPSQAMEVLGIGVFRPPRGWGKGKGSIHVQRNWGRGIRGSSPACIYKGRCPPKGEQVEENATICIKARGKGESGKVVPPGEGPVLQGSKQGGPPGQAPLKQVQPKSACQAGVPSWEGEGWGVSKGLAPFRRFARPALQRGRGQGVSQCLSKACPGKQTPTKFKVAGNVRGGKGGRKEEEGRGAGGWGWERQGACPSRKNGR